MTFKAKRIQDPDPFKESYSRIPVTVEIVENNKLVESDSVTAHFGNSYENIGIDMNNDPKVGGSFNVIISFDIPEDNGDDREIRVDTNRIRIIDNKKKNDLDIIRISIEN